jgi:hypothetical protein
MTVGTSAIEARPIISIIREARTGVAVGTSAGERSR